MITINEVKQILVIYEAERGVISNLKAKHGFEYPVIFALTKMSTEYKADPTSELAGDALHSVVMALLAREIPPKRSDGTFPAHERAAVAIESKIEFYAIYRELYHNGLFANYIFHLFYLLKLPEHWSSLPDNAKMHFTNALNFLIKSNKQNAPLYCQWLMQLDPYQLSVLTELITEPSTDDQVNPVFLAIKLNQTKRNIAGMTPESFGQHFNAHLKRYQTRIDLCSWLLKNLFPLENPDRIDQCLTSYVDEYLNPSRGNNLIRYGNSPFPEDSRMSDKIFTLLIALSPELPEERLYNLIEFYNEPLLIQLDQMKIKLDQKKIDEMSKGITNVSYFYDDRIPLRLLDLSHYIRQIKVCFNHIANLNRDVMFVLLTAINEQRSILDQPEPVTHKKILDYKLYILVKLYTRKVFDLDTYKRIRDTIVILPSYNNQPTHKLIDALISNFLPFIKAKNPPSDICECFLAVTQVVGTFTLTFFKIFNAAGGIHNDYKARIEAMISENRVKRAAHQVSMLFHDDRLKGRGLFSLFPLPVLAKIAGWVEPGLSENRAEKVAGWHLHIKPQKR